MTAQNKPATPTPEGESLEREHLRKVIEGCRQDSYTDGEIADAVLMHGYRRPAPTQGDRETAREICDGSNYPWSALENRVATALAARAGPLEARVAELEKARDHYEHQSAHWMAECMRARKEKNAAEAALAARAAPLEARVRELERDNFALAANQCHEGYAGEHGDHMCRIADRLRAAESALATAREDALRRVEEIVVKFLRRLDHPDVDEAAIKRIAAAIAAERGGKG